MSVWSEKGDKRFGWTHIPAVQFEAVFIIVEILLKGVGSLDKLECFEEMVRSSAYTIEVVSQIEGLEGHGGINLISERDSMESCGVPLCRSLKEERVW